jgi:hypothetical protein
MTVMFYVQINLADQHKLIALKPSHAHKDMLFVTTKAVDYLAAI